MGYNYKMTAAGRMCLTDYRKQSHVIKGSHLARMILFSLSSFSFFSLVFSLKLTGPDQIMIILTGQENDPNQKETEDPKPLVTAKPNPNPNPHVNM